MKWFNKLVERLYFSQEGNLALYDQLTKVYNYNWLQFVGSRKYYEREVYVTVFDVNEFKKINDTEGHECGNLLLRDIASQLVKLRVMDPSVEVVRYGGDEFITISNTDLSDVIDLVNEKKKRLSYGTVLKPRKEYLSVAFAKADNLMYQYKMKLKTSDSNE